MAAATLGVLYRVITIARPLSSNEAVLYRCFERIPSGGYVVQSADRVRLPIDKDALREHEAQLWELFIEEPPDSRGEAAPTIETAIEKFHALFD